MWKKGAVNDEGYFKLTSAYSQELLLTATSAKLLEIKGKTLSTLTGKKIYKKNKCLHYSSYQLAPVFGFKSRFFCSFKRFIPCQKIIGCIFLHRTNKIYSGKSWFKGKRRWKLTWLVLLILSFANGSILPMLPFIIQLFIKSSMGSLDNTTSFWLWRQLESQILYVFIRLEKVWK